MVLLYDNEANNHWNDMFRAILFGMEVEVVASSLVATLFPTNNTAYTSSPFFSSTSISDLLILIK